MNNSLHTQPLRVTIWNEFIHERNDTLVQAIYPEGLHATIRSALQEHLQDQVEVRCATLDEPEHGLTDVALAETDTLFWWGHRGHDQVADAVVERVQRAVLAGMGLVVLHSGHASKIFKRLMGTGCMLRWRVDGELERLWITAPGHPILEGIEGDFFELPAAEMYGEHFDIPQPDEILLISWFAGGEVFRSGCTFQRGQGKIFYFRPGHETYPIYHDKNVRRVLANAAQWARARKGNYRFDARHIPERLS